MEIDYETAVRRLTNRWREQCALSAWFREWIPLSLYISRNIACVTSGAAPLEQYDREV
jgi:hypothetical protein